jgi:CheY-like chemotaxis protein
LVGYTAVDETASGVQALEWAQKRHYDLVIVGRNLPDMDGWALIRQLVGLEPAIGSVLVSTSDKSWHTREYAQACGCSGLLEQPYDPLQVAQVLKAL